MTSQATRVRPQVAPTRRARRQQRRRGHYRRVVLLVVGILAGLALGLLVAWAYIQSSSLGLN